MVLGLSKLRNFWRQRSQADDIPGPRYVRRHSFHRKINQSFLRIREITKEDESHVKKLLFDHFRQLTFPAITYWFVQHVYDLVAIIVILSFILPIKRIIYFCVSFLVYLYVRARYEMEKHIRDCCPDLDGVFETYRTAQGANFWVGYFSNQDDTESTRDSSISRSAPLTETKPAEPSDDKQAAAVVGKGTDDQQSDRKEASINGETEAASDCDVTHKGQDAEKQPLLGAQQATVAAATTTDDEPPMKLKDVLNKTNCKENEILGCIGITPYRNKSTIAQMVRLVVSKKCRNMKVGSRLLSHLEKYAVSFGYTEIRVYTNNLNTAYLQFLKQNGFVIQQLVRRGLMRGDLIIWNKTLSQPKDLLVPGTSDTQKESQHAETESTSNMGVSLILE